MIANIVDIVQREKIVAVVVVEVAVAVVVVAVVHNIGLVEVLVAVGDSTIVGDYYSSGLDYCGYYWYWDNCSSVDSNSCYWSCYC